MDSFTGWNKTALRMIQLCSLFYSSLVLASSAVVTETSKGTPPIVPDHVKTKYVVQEGTKNWKLTCAAEGERPLLITWIKDGESITSAWPRYKQANDAKDLKIKNVASEDAGVYKCRAANGFGSVEVEYTVTVIGKDEPLPPTLNDYSEDEFVPPDLSLSDTGGITSRAPFWVDGDPSTANQQSVLVRSIGGTVRLRCHATGVPKPDIIWVKDGNELDDAIFSWSRGKWALHLKDLRESDSGVYTCRVFNIWGSLNATYVVKVTNGDPSLPEFEKSHPLNSTVTEGQPATFHCRVRSVEKPIIQWVKVIDDPSHLDFNQSVVVQGMRITVLDAKYQSEIEDFRNATWLKRLVIPSVTGQDGGWYLCVVTSQKGHLAKRFAYLQVTPVYQQVPMTDQFPLHIVVGIPVAFVLLLVVGYAVYFLQKHQQKPSLSGGSSNGHRPPPPPSYPPPSLPNSSFHKASPFRSSATTFGSKSNGHHFPGTGSQTDQSQQQHQQLLHQHQPLLYTKEDPYVAGHPTPPAPPSSVYKMECKKPYLQHQFLDVDPSTRPLNTTSDMDGVYESTNTPQPYEFRYDDDSNFSDSYDEHGGPGRIQHYPSLYSCR